MLKKAYFSVKDILSYIRATKTGQFLLSRLHGGSLGGHCSQLRVQTLDLILKPAWRLPGGHCSQLRVQTLDLILKPVWRLPGGHCSQLRVQTLDLIHEAVCRLPSGIAPN